MRTAELLEKRRLGWVRLDELCERLRNTRIGKIPAEELTEFAALYRAACTDLAMADQLNLPPATIEYLQGLVGRSHSQLYQTSGPGISGWWKYITATAPQAIFNDICVKIACAIFFGMFTLAAFLAWAEDLAPRFAETVLGRTQIETLERSFSLPLREASSNYPYARMAAGYIQHNTGIGLQCFALGPLIFPSLLKLAFNALTLGASFGYMARPNVRAGDNFFEFVTAHGVFELTAIALSSAAGLRLGIGWLVTNGLTRYDSFVKNGRKAMPIIIVAVILFILAAFTEGFLSPSSAPYAVKTFFALGSASLLMFYFVILGYPRSDSRLR